MTVHASFYADQNLRLAKQMLEQQGRINLLAGAVEGLLNVLVEDWQADVPVARTGWESPATTWQAIHQARGVLDAAKTGEQST